MEGNANNRYTSVRYFLKAEDNEECKDVVESKLKQWMNKKRDGEYDGNMNIKKLIPPTLPNIEREISKFIWAGEMLCEI